MIPFSPALVKYLLTVPLPLFLLVEYERTLRMLFGIRRVGNHSLTTASFGVFRPPLRRSFLGSSSMTE